MTNVLLSLSELPLISVRSLFDTTEGMEVEIPLYCYYVLMEENATISFNYSSMGITPGWGGATR